MATIDRLERPGRSTVSYSLKQQALELIDRKQSGQKRLDSRKFIFTRADEHGTANLIKRLETLPDIARESPAAPFEPSQYDLWRADRAAGMTYRAIAEKYDQPYGRVWQITHSVEVVTPRPRKNAAHHQKGKPVATRMADSEALAKRCEQAGWQTTRSTKGISVMTPEGPYAIHLTYSDRRSLNLTVADLERRGLREAERDAELLREAERKRRIAEDRAAAERATQKAQERAMTRKAAVVKAAGDYLVEPETVPLSWFTQEHPAPKMKWVWMTPPIAKFLLDFHNKPGGAGVAGTNRPQSETQIAHYRDIIVSGQWRLTHQGMAMDTSAMVQDGQHRLAALLAATEVPADPAIGWSPDGLRVPVAFFVGMDPDNFKAIDEGLLRRASQLFSRDGERNTGTLQSAIRLVIAYRENNENARNLWRRRNTNAEILEVFGANPQALRLAASVANSHARKAYLSGASFAALHYLLYAANGPDNRFVDAFFHGLMTGTKLGTTVVDGRAYELTLPGDDPRAAVRRMLQSYRERNHGRPATGMDQLGMGILAWNLLVEGRHRQNLRWSKDTEIPQVLICKDAPGAVPPRALIGEVDTAAREVDSDA